MFTSQNTESNSSGIEQSQKIQIQSHWTLPDGVEMVQCIVKAISGRRLNDYMKKQTKGRIGLCRHLRKLIDGITDYIKVNGDIDEKLSAREKEKIADIFKNFRSEGAIGLLDISGWFLRKKVDKFFDFASRSHRGDAKISFRTWRSGSDNGVYKGVLNIAIPDTIIHSMTFSGKDSLTIKVAILAPNRGIENWLKGKQRANFSNFGNVRIELIGSPEVLRKIGEKLKNYNPSRLVSRNSGWMNMSGNKSDGSLESAIKHAIPGVHEGLQDESAE